MNSVNGSSSVVANSLIDFLKAVFGNAYYYAYYDLEKHSGYPICASDCDSIQHVAFCNNCIHDLVSGTDRKNLEEQYLSIHDESTGYKANVLVLRNGDGLPEGLLLISYDENGRLQFLSEMEKIFNVRRNTFPIAMPEIRDGEKIKSLSELPALIHRLCEDCPVDASGNLSHQDRTRIIGELRKHGVFSFKGAVRNVAQLLKISVPSVYRILNSLGDANYVEMPSQRPVGNIRLI